MLVLIWLIRFIVYGGLAVISLGFIAPAIGGQLGIFLSAPIAGLAVLIDIVVTARFRKTTVENIVSSRILMLDSVLSEDKKQGSEKTLEIEGEVIEPYKIEDRKD